MENATVTLDVLHSGVIWGWFVTMNFWAKSISTGVILLAPWVYRNYPEQRMRLIAPLLGFVFLNITLLFTVMDLHQPFRFWHMFVYPHFTSILNLGGWVLTIYNFLLVVHVGLEILGKRQDIYDRLMPVTWVVAFLATIYTAGLLGQASARELWHPPTEVAQMILAATLAGSAVYLLLRVGEDRGAKDMATVLGLSATASLTIFIAELVLAPQRSEDAEYVIHHILLGEPLKAIFVGGLVLAYVVPMILSLITTRVSNLPPLGMLAGASSLVGLWMVKHAWLIAPQLVPLS